MEKPKILTYKEWIAFHKIEPEMEECEHCGGDGEHECDCGDLHDCKHCKGKGETDITEEKYHMQKRAELKKWEEWNKASEVK